MKLTYTIFPLVLKSTHWVISVWASPEVTKIDAPEKDKKVQQQTSFERDNQDEHPNSKTSMYGKFLISEIPIIITITIKVMTFVLNKLKHSNDTSSSKFRYQLNKVESHSFPPYSTPVCLWNNPRSECFPEWYNLKVFKSMASRYLSS